MKLNKIVALTLGSVLAASMSIYSYFSNSTVINGERTNHKDIPERNIVVDFEQPDLDDIVLTRDGIVEMYRDAKENRTKPMDTFVDPKQVQPIADNIAANSESEAEYLLNLLEFVNDNVTYEHDSLSYYFPTRAGFYKFIGLEDRLKINIPKGPLQTLNDGKGDCEDYSILLASLLAAKGVRTGLAFSPGHAAIGVEFDLDRYNDLKKFVSEMSPNLDMNDYDKQRFELVDKITHPDPNIDMETYVGLLNEYALTNFGVVDFDHISPNIEFEILSASEGLECGEDYWDGNMLFELVPNRMIAQKHGQIRGFAPEEATFGQIFNYSRRTFADTLKDVESIVLGLHGADTLSIVVKRLMNYFMEGCPKNISSEKTYFLGNKTYMEEIGLLSELEELFLLKEGKKLDQEELKRRIDFIFMDVNYPKHTIYSGEEARALVGDEFKEKYDDTDEVEGMCASKGKTVGVARIVHGRLGSENMKQGDILVTGMTRPEMLPIMKKASAIVTDEGGITCHAAIVSRELGIPCIIGTHIATKVFNNGDRLEVDAEKGVVRKIE